MKLLLSTLLALVPAATLPAAETLPPAASILHTVEADAAAQHKNILVSFGASWCGNCHLFDRFLQDPTIHPIMSKAFVTTELITGERPDDQRHSNTPGGLAYERSLAGEDPGWPYLAILDPSGKLLVDSYRPVHGKAHADNIGYPFTPEEVDWFVHMLQVAGPALSPADLTTIHTWLTTHGAH